MALLAVLLMVAVPATSFGSLAWGNGSSTSVEFTDFGLHDITCDIALRTATYTSPELLTWMTDWYIRNETDYGYSFDGDNDWTGPTSTDNINAYTDDPDSYWKDWDNHTLYLHPRNGWDPAEGDAARRVSQLYNQTVDHIYGWLMNGSVRYDTDQHYAAYYGGLMAHYLMDITQFGHTDWTRLDHSNPPGYDPQVATYHSYYEARTWTDTALRHAHMDLMSNPLPQVERVSDPAQVVRELAEFVNGRHGPDVQFDDIDLNTVTLGSTYVLMLETFVANWDSGVSFNGARGYDPDLWNLTQENLVAGMWNLTNLWTSAYLDAQEMFEKDAADIVIERVDIWPEEGVYEGQGVTLDLFIANNGSTPTGTFEMALFIDDEMIEVLTLNNDLQPGESSNLGGDLWVAVAGTHEITLVADVYQKVPESNESNNVWSTEYTVLAEHHESKMTAEHQVLEILQEDTGWFDLTLENLGNRDDVYDISVNAYPGTIDFSLTLPVEDIYIPALSNRTFRIDVATILDNPVGPRNFAMTAMGGNSTVGIGLTVIIKERQLAPFIEVEYDFFTNVSVPVSFDASGSWDHNGDEIAFRWYFGDGTHGTGAVVEHTYDAEGVYVIILNASDGDLHRSRTLEVSVLDAVPTDIQLMVTDVDFNAARFQWTVWNSTRYFTGYRLYLSDDPDMDQIVRPENLLTTVDLFYVDNATLRVPPGDIRYAVLEIVNLYGDAFRSNVAEVVLELRTRTYPQEDPLHYAEVYASSNLLSAIELEWREWEPLLAGTSTRYIPGLISTDQIGSAHPTTAIVDIDGSGIHSYLFADLSSNEYMVWVDYMSGEDSIRVGPVFVDLNPTNWSLRFFRIPPTLNGVAGKELELPIELTYVGRTSGNFSVDWGDGSALETWDYVFEDNDSINMTLFYTYAEEGNYTIRVNDTREGRIIWSNGGWHYYYYTMFGLDTQTSAQALAVISAAEEDDDEPTPWTDYIIAIGLILFIAAIGVLAGHVTGYYRIGSGGKRKVEPSDEEPVEEEEPEQTAEEIISELEEDLGDEGDEDDEYLDHEPTVAELEAMIPRDRDH